MGKEHYEDDSAKREGNHCAADEEQGDKHVAVSRRKALGGVAAIGMTAIAAGALARITAEREGDLNNPTAVITEGSANEVDVSSACSIVPGDEVAQSLLIALCPERLACLAAPLSSYEVASNSALANLPVMKYFDCYSGEESDFERLGEVEEDAIAGADLVLYAGIGNLGVCREAQEAFYDQTAVPYVTFCTEAGGMAALLEQVASALGVSPSAAAVSCLQVVDKVQLSAAGVNESQRFRIAVCGGECGEVSYGQGSSLYEMRELACAEQADVPGFADGPFIVEGGDLSSLDVDFVFLTDEKGYRLYVGKTEGDGLLKLCTWWSTEMSSIGDVLPALVSRRVWVAEMSPFAQLTLGSAWLSNFLYPEPCSCDVDDLVTQFYSELFHTSPSDVSLADDAVAALAAKCGKTCEQIRAERKEHVDQAKAEFAEMWEKTMEENTRPPTDAEMAEIEAYAQKVKEQQQRNRELVGLE